MSVLQSDVQTQTRMVYSELVSEGCPFTAEVRIACISFNKQHTKKRAPPEVLASYI
jgi:hypothetical protein